jgi:hypothetical protein
MTRRIELTPRCLLVNINLISASLPVAPSASPLSNGNPISVSTTKGEVEKTGQVTDHVSIEPSAAETTEKSVETLDTQAADLDRIKQLEARLAELTTEKERIDFERLDVVRRNHQLGQENLALDDTSRALREQCEALQRQLDQKSKEFLTVQRDNVLLRAQISDMTNAQDPLREENYYIREFAQLATTVETMAAKETHKMSKKPLSDSDSLQLVSTLRTYGDSGIRAAEWFGNQDRKYFQERRNRIALIRHIIAIVLFDAIFDRFAFGLEREYSEYFKSIENELCGNGISASGEN